MADIVIVGSGPAGISAAIYASRAGLDTVVIGKGGGALEKTDKIENYYGFEHPVAGAYLLEQGRKQAANVGAKVVTGEVVGVNFEEKLTVRTKDEAYPAGAVILATGSSRTAPKIPGIAEFEGKGVSYCALCDAFFYKGKDVAVLGGGEYAVHEALELLPTSRSVTMLTGGGRPAAEIPEGILADEREIEAFEGDSAIRRVRFQDGSVLEIAGLFIAVGVAGSADFAKKLGAETEGAKIVVDENMATAVPGLYAAGDCTGGLLQIAKAVYEGAKAGTEAVKYVRKLKQKEK